MLGKGHSGLCKAPTKEEGERLRRERDQIKFSDLRFERWQVVRFTEARRRQDVPLLASECLSGCGTFLHIQCSVVLSEP